MVTPLHKLLRLALLYDICRASFVVPGLDTKVYFRDGDLVLGGFLRLHHFSPTEMCSSSVGALKNFKYQEAIVFAISTINEDDTLLPNTTLGFAILDDCTKEQTAMARAMAWVRPAPCCACNASSSAPYYAVVGVVSGSASSFTLAVADLLNIFRIPIVGAVSTSELLNNKVKYNTFLRVVPSDRFQAQVIIDVLLHFNWTYISVVNSPGGYGEMGIKAVKALAELNGICIAYSHEIDEARGETEYEKVVYDLVRFQNAHAVVFFADDYHTRMTITTAHRLGYRKRFIWITSDGFNPGAGLAGLEETGSGGFHVRLYSKGVPGFPAYFENLTPATSDNPWLDELWQWKFNCSQKGAKGYRKCEGTRRMADLLAENDKYSNIDLMRDAVKTLAYGLHDYIEKNCPAAFGDRAAVRACVDPSELTPYLYNVTFQGSYGPIQFDKMGNADGMYEIHQLQKEQHSNRYVMKTIGQWDKAAALLTLDEVTYWNPDPADVAPGRAPDSVPESVCSHPCKPGEFYVQLELKCCWNCRLCRNNEITVNNASSCEECSPFSWPDGDTITACVAILPTYLHMAQMLPACSLAVAVVGLAASAAVLAVYVTHRESRLIKATSRELSLIALAGNVVSYMAAIAFATKPEPLSCYVGRVGFNISICIVYASLLTKVNRIYRIFQGAKKGTQRPALTGSRAQVTIASIFILVQIIISSVTTVMAPPNVTMRMPVRTEKYVELLCALPLSGFLPSLVYNLILIFSCSLYAFKARKLPANFNESRYIFVTVCTTIFLWVAFLPTYFSAFYATQKALLLSTMLLMNASVILLCMYFPPVYALYYVEDEQLQLQTSMVVDTAARKVAPLGGDPARAVSPTPQTG